MAIKINFKKQRKFKVMQNIEKSLDCDMKERLIISP